MQTAGMTDPPIDGDDKDKELYACMKMLNSDFVAEVGENLIMTRVWKR